MSKHYQCGRCNKWWTEKHLKEKDCWGRWGVGCPECGGVVIVKSGGIVLDGKMGTMKRGWNKNEKASVDDFKDNREALSEKHGEDFHRMHGYKEDWKD